MTVGLLEASRYFELVRLHITLYSINLVLLTTLLILITDKMLK